MYREYRNQAAAAYLSLYLFIFLSLQVSTLNFFVTLFSGTVESRRLTRGIGNQAAAAYLSLYFFIFLSLQFSDVKIFRHSSDEM